MIYTINKQILLENSADFQAMMRNQSISGNTMSSEDMHRQALMKDGKDVTTDAMNAANKVTNTALHIDNLAERQAALQRQSKGIQS